MLCDITGSVDTASVTDDELVAQAIAADPTDELPDEKVSFDELTGVVAHELLPDWYMPRPGPSSLGAV